MIRLDFFKSANISNRKGTLVKEALWNAFIGISVRAVSSAGSVFVMSLSIHDM